jgi:hypothetical protein
LPPLEYPGHFLVKRVTSAGTLRLKHKPLFIANALKPYRIGLEETDDGIWSNYFGTVLLARVNALMPGRGLSRLLGNAELCSARRGIQIMAMPVTLRRFTVDEVLSWYDRDIKRDALLQVGVGEVWLVDLEGKAVFVTRSGGPTDVAHRDVLTWQVPGTPVTKNIDLGEIFIGPD